MIRVETGSRLHFGLLRLAGEGRHFGGAGMMLDAPGVAVRVERAHTWLADADVMDLVHRVVAGRDVPHRRVILESTAPQHAGLGTGTQTALAVARALTLSWGEDWAIPELARLVTRGKRSAIGVHGFEHGGFLVDGGKSQSVDLAPLLARVAFPADWRILVIIPPIAPGLAGAGELSAFARLNEPHPAITDAICRLLLLGVLPSLIEHDFAAFSESLSEYNALSGELFAKVQGGIYSSDAVTQLIARLRQFGVNGVGQSSWGPGVFAVVEEDHAAQLTRRARDEFPGAQVWLTTGRNCPATSS